MQRAPTRNTQAHIHSWSSITSTHDLQLQLHCLPCHVLCSIRFHRFATSLSHPLHPIPRSHPFFSDIRQAGMYVVGLHAFLAQQSIAHLISSAIMMFMFCETRLLIHYGPSRSKRNERRERYRRKRSLSGGHFWAPPYTQMPG